MSAELVAASASPFDAIRRVRADGSEYWPARDLMPVAEYERWENFRGVIGRAMTAAENTGVAVQTNFRSITKNVPVGFGERVVEDIELSRFGCYLVFMNGDPHKPAIAAAQAYFAIRTREAEVAEQRNAVVAEQRNAVSAAPEDRAIKRLEVLQAAKGLIDPHHLEAKARCQIAIGLGEAPELDASCRPLYAQDYLKERGLTHRQIKTASSMFGKRLKSAYVEHYGVAPKQYPLETGAGQIRNVNAYTESDRALMDSVWHRFYAAGVL